MLISYKISPSSALAVLHARAAYPQTAVLVSAGAAAGTLLVFLRAHMHAWVGEQSIHGRITWRADKSQTAVAAKSKLLLVVEIFGSW